MPKFSGQIGFVTQQETSPGVWVENAHEHRYFGDVVRASRNYDSEQSVNTELTIENSFSVVADGFLRENLGTIRYVSWMGVRWTVESVSLASPRLLLRVGGVYSGPTPSAS